MKINLTLFAACLALAACQPTNVGQKTVATPAASPLIPSSSTGLASKLTGGPGKAAIASSHQLATDAGLEVLAAGGNAFDAAIAVGSTLAVIEPSSSGIGGGAFFLLHQASDCVLLELGVRDQNGLPSGSRGSGGRRRQATIASGERKEGRGRASA